MEKKIYLSIMAAIATVVAVWFFAQLAAPIAKPVAWALIIGIATLPHHDRLAGKFPGHSNRCAGVMVLAIAVCFLLPVAALILMVAHNATGWYQDGERLARAFTAPGAGTLSHLPYAREIITLGERFGIDLFGFAAKLAAGASQYFLDGATNTAKNLGELLFTLAVALFMLFFIYRDGERIVSAAIIRFAADKDKTRRYLSEIRATTTAVTVGTIFTCLVQGLTAGIGYYCPPRFCLVP